jgi:uncharacterized protein (DUF488 family)
MIAGRWSLVVGRWSSLQFLVVTTATSSILTIGYGARSLDEFLDVLGENGVAYLVDVRRWPRSRYKPDFSRPTLEPALAERGIIYVHMGEELGGRPDDPGSYVEGHVDYELVAESEPFRAGLARLRTIHEKQLPAVLMCSEGKPELCHRSTLIGEALAKEGIVISHIDPDGTLISHPEVMLRITGPQLSMGADLAPPLRSRKKYQPSGSE